MYCSTCVKNFDWKFCASKMCTCEKILVRKFWWVYMYIDSEGRSHVPFRFCSVIVTSPFASGTLECHEELTVLDIM